MDGPNPIEVLAKIRLLRASRMVRRVLQVSLATVVIWFPLFCAAVLGGTTWDVLPMWFTPTLVFPGLILAGVIQLLPADRRRPVLAVVAVTSALVAVIGFAVYVDHPPPIRIDLRELLGRQHFRWHRELVLHVSLYGSIAATVGPSALLGVLIGLWLNRRRV